MTSRGYGITQKDMEASRLVFVSLSGAKPRRKVAVPIPEGATWQQFVSQVQSKLKLLAVGSIVHVSSGEVVTELDQLQDIDELLVQPGVEPEPAASTAPSAAVMGGLAASTLTRQPSHAAHAHIAVDGLDIVDNGPGDASTSGGVPDADGADAKYAKRGAPLRLRRLLAAVLPSAWLNTAASRGLPVTRGDVDGSRGGSSKRRRRRGSRDVRNFILMIAIISVFGLATMLSIRTLSMAADEASLAPHED